MKNNKIIEDFINIYINNIEITSIEYNGNDFTFKIKNFDNNNKKEIIKSLKSVFRNVEELLSNKFRINIENLLIENVFIYYNFQNFQNNYLKYKNNFKESKIIILKNEDSKNLIIKNENENISLLNNYKLYRDIIEYFNKSPLFVSIPTTNNEFLLITKGFGFIHLGYDLHENRLVNFNNLENDFKRLKILFEKKEFIQFFKENIGNIGIHRYDIQQRFYHLIVNLNSLLNLSEKDLDTYILEFSFEKVKSKFKDERNKYFEGLEKNIELISKQVVSFPLTFAATAFASYQVKDKSFILFFIILGYTLYTIIAFRILKITSYNIKCLELDISKEEENIKNNYNKVFSEFEDDFIKIYNKTKKIKQLLIYLKIILYTMLLMFIGYFFYQIFILKVEIKKETISIPIEKINYIKIDDFELKILILDTIKKVTKDNDSLNKT